MPTKPLSQETLREALDAVAQHGTTAAAAAALGINRNTLDSRVQAAKRAGLTAAPVPVQNEDPDLSVRVLVEIKKRPGSLDDLAERLDMPNRKVQRALAELAATGYMIEPRDGIYSLNDGPANPAFMVESDLPTYTSRPDGTYLFGACGDNHLGSKYARLDVLNALYDRYAEEGVDRVFNTGNWIDGEARFNKHDLLVHGMDAQLRYLADNYPVRKGIDTYAVAGDDHEGWYAQSFGVDIGRRAEHTMRDAGRRDWHNLGYMESHIRLVHAQSGKSSILAVVHPGGGSAYALSYSIQKIIESLEGGEKPAVGLYGHYHKLWAGNIRNVWCLQTGTTEDQTPFMRKKRLEAHVGGCLVKLRQDPKSGAITEFTPTIMRFFNRGFYNNRWDHGGDVTHAHRSVA